MDAPVYTTLKSAPSVVALLQMDAGSQLRVYPSGAAPQDVVRPYLTYTLIAGSPENNLNQIPDIDHFSDQIDIYGLTEDDVLAVGKVVRDALEAVAYITAWLGISQEPDTKLYRLAFQVDWYTDRT